MGNLFGKKTKTVSKITEQDRAVLQLKQQRDKLKQYQRRIETSLEKDRTLAKSLVADGKKERALLLLRKKRYQETLLSNTDKQLHNLEQLTSDIEFAQIEIQVVEGLKVGNKALKDINDALNIEDIERMLDETKEAFDKQQEINDLLSGVLTSEDEDAVLEELDMLVQQEVDELPAVEQDADIAADENIADLSLPEVPQERVKPKKEQVKHEKVAVLES